MLKVLYNKILNYLLCVKININNNKYNCKLTKKCRNVIFLLKLFNKNYIELMMMNKINK